MAIIFVKYIVSFVKMQFTIIFNIWYNRTLTNMTR